jgi:hypothetical protein
VTSLRIVLSPSRAELGARLTRNAKANAGVVLDAMRATGKPMLWIPLSFASDAVGIRAGEYPGSLFRVNRAGKAPLLMTRQGKGPAEAKYFGKESVTEPKKFHLVEIIKEVSSEMPGLYRDNFRRLKSNG